LEYIKRHTHIGEYIYLNKQKNIYILFSKILKNAIKLRKKGVRILSNVSCFINIFGKCYQKGFL